MRKVYLAGLLALGSVVFNSCLPEPGCTDLTAENYNPEAEENDGSCIDSRLKLIGNYRYTRVWTDVFTEMDTMDFGVAEITESGSAKNGFYFNLDGTRILTGVVSAFDLIMDQYSAQETYMGFDFTRTYSGTGEWLTADTVDMVLTLNTQGLTVSGTPPALTQLPQSYSYYFTKTP